jgi:hypothetical protein
MLNNIFIRHFLIFICCFATSTSLYAPENTTEYEGWVWTKSPMVKTPSKDIHVEGIHREMQKSLQDPSIRGYAKKESSGEGKNVVFLRIGFIVNNQIEYEYKPTNCFKKAVFFSGSEVREERAKETSDLIKFANYSRVEPIGYSYKPKEIQEELEERFSHDGLSSTSLNPEVYRKFSFRDLTNPNHLSDAFKRESQDQWLNSLQRVIENFEENTLYIHDKHAHSEPKALFFLNKGVSSLPCYWGFQLEPALNRAVEAARNFILRNHIFFTPDYVDLTLKDFQSDALNASTRIDLKNKYAWIKESIQREVEKNLPDLRKKALMQVNTLRDILFKIDRLQVDNPLQLELSDPNSFKVKSYQALGKLEELLSRKPYTRLQEIEKDMRELSGLEFALLYQDQEAIGDEDWVASLVRSLSSLEQEEEVTDIILHWHSRYDVCESCAPAIARECERQDGFITRLKSIIMARNPQFLLPNCQVIVSCGEIRPGCEERFTSEVFNDPTKAAKFTQTLLQ